MRYFSFQDLRMPAWALSVALFFVASLFIHSGCSSKPKAKPSKRPAVAEPKSPTTEETALAPAKSSSASSKLNKADAKEDCKKKGFKGKELKGCMRELMSK